MAYRDACGHCGARRLDAQLGLEKTPEAYVANLVAVFREVRRVLRPDGTVWCNLGDAFASKQLLGLPWRVAFALQADGWYLRADIIWAKPNPMPESVTDRPTRSHEYLFLLAKSEKYYFDAEAIKEPASNGERFHGARQDASILIERTAARNGRADAENWTATRNRRSVWTIATQPYPEAHFATFPSALVTPCVLAGSRPGDTVLDPFAGAGTTLHVAKALGRRAVGIELSAAYLPLITARLRQGVLF